ncbi:MAG: hypothetical protein KJO44_03135 [Gemmatimonadetes bacterium]|nr:hypothetical protein [Gemmatimonadota bacterium]MBT8477689.1 hypothetical protein [Gemmatimonadota bacterium]
MRRTAMLVVAFGALVGPGTQVRAQEAIGDFYYFERADATSAEDRSSITTLADENYVSGAGGLTFRCAPGGFEMVVTATYLGRNTSTPVSYVFGDEEPKTASWGLRSTGMAAIAPPEARDEFLARGVAEESVVVRVSDFQLRSHTYTFNLNGLAAGLTRLTCR